MKERSLRRRKQRQKEEDRKEEKIREKLEREKKKQFQELCGTWILIGRAIIQSISMENSPNQKACGTNIFPGWQ